MPLLSDQITGNEDLVTIKSEEETDTLNMMFESPNQVHFMHTLLFVAFFHPIARYFVVHATLSAFHNEELTSPEFY